MAREHAADAARSAFYARLERAVDPHGKLSPAELDRWVRGAARAFSARLNLRASPATSAHEAQQPLSNPMGR